MPARHSSAGLWMPISWDRSTRRIYREAGSSRFRTIKSLSLGNAFDHHNTDLHRLLKGAFLQRQVFDSALRLMTAILFPQKAGVDSQVVH